MLSKKREAVDKHESVGRSDKVSPAKDEVLEVNSSKWRQPFFFVPLKIDSEASWNSSNEWLFEVEKKWKW